MASRFRFIAVMLVLAALLLGGCGQPATPEPANRLNVTVSILPQKYFVQRIGGEHVTVNVMVGPGDEPHTYEPKPEQLRALSRSAVYLSIGVDFENAWLDRIASISPEIWIVDMTQGIERMPVQAHYHEEAGEEHASGEEPANPDPHIWTLPALVKIQAQTIFDALAQMDPVHKAAYEANLQRFLQDIDALDTDIRQTLQRMENRKFMVFHPAWGYFARGYGLEMIPIEIGGQEPSAAELAELIREAKKEGIRVILAQPEFSTRDAETIAEEIGGEVLLISPLAPDWLDNLRRVAATFAAVLGE
jgi:zinc transport system substrate-binding protein